jgi:hydroxymethylpyrimidine pyrophosphatase-like HAD family hydrolase
LDTQAKPGPTGHDVNATDFFIESEVRFYSRYPWCLNPFLRVEQAIGFLRAEVNHLDEYEDGWQKEEVMTNIFLLSCGISSAADDCLSGKRHDFSNIKGKFRPFGSIFSIVEKILIAKQRRVEAKLKELSLWRKQWEDSLHGLLRIHVQTGSVDMAGYRKAARVLVNLLDHEFPDEFTGKIITSPRAFKSQDYTFKDILLLAEKFCAEFTDRRAPYLLVGLRTAGSYFAPILRAYMFNLGYEDVGILTLRPKNGVNRSDMEILRRYSGRNGLAVIVDEPVYQGVTLAICIRLLQNAGFPAKATAAVFPVHPAARDWQYTNASVALNGCRVITLQPEETYIYGLLHSEAAEETLRAYFAARGCTDIVIGEDNRSRELNSLFFNESWHTRLKRVFSAQMRLPSGEIVTHHIIAKSVGHGWMGYQAFFAARALAKFVPPILGFRDGILYSEWVGAGQTNIDNCDRKTMIESIAQYTAARVQGLGFQTDPSPALCRAGLQSGMDVLEEKLSRAYAHKIMVRLKKPVIRSELALLSSPFPILVDGNNRRSEWVATDEKILKTNFEQYGMGKVELSVTDPAYDLADAILSFGLSHAEEHSLLDQYALQTGDSAIAERLPLYKLLVGENHMGSTPTQSGNANITARHAELNKSHIDGWTFSMIQMARFCATFLPDPVPSITPGPVVFSDVDGVIDQHIFNFPTTTPSGIRALALLGGHGIPVYLNTARSGYDVREYCKAYRLAGGVAESGSYLWDAVTRQEKVLVGEQSLAEIDRVRQALERIPGVFTNHYYHYSIKAFTYDGARTVSLPTALIQKVLAEAGAKTLSIHHTHVDTAITARDLDKGTGLLAMLSFIGKEDMESVAIGDTGPDLAMFRVANRSYAPSHTPVRSLATLLGCRVVGGAYQAGFLEIARHIVHPDGATCACCAEPDFSAKGQARLLIDLLGEVEKRKLKLLLGALLDKRFLNALKEYLP